MGIKQWSQCWKTLILEVTLLCADKCCYYVVGYDSARGGAESRSIVIIVKEILECAEMSMVRWMCSVIVRDGPTNVELRKEIWE